MGKGIVVGDGNLCDSPLLHAHTHIDNASSLRFCEGVGCFVLLNHASFSTVCHICNIHISREYQPVSNIAPVVTKF